MGERYKIKGQIGKGGVGAVYEAFDNTLNRSVAIKRLLPEEESEVSEGGIGTDLVREAEILSSLHHPNIIALYDVAHDEELPSVVMELIDGETIEDVVERGAMTQDDFGTVVEQTLEALAAAQEKNLLHRDIKPTNIMVQWLGAGGFQIKVLDFGLAKYSLEPAVQTVDHGGAILGSIYFLAPEQFERTPLDPRTDLYALGCVLYYCLTKKYPFDGETAPDVMMAHLEWQVEPIGDIRPDLPKALCSWVMRLISRSMEDRPPDAKTALLEYRKIIADPDAASVLEKPPTPLPSAVAARKTASPLPGTTSRRLVMGDAAPTPDQVRRSLTSRAVASAPHVSSTTSVPLPGSAAPRSSLTSKSVLVASEEVRRKIPALPIIFSGLALLAIVGVAVAVWTNRNDPSPSPPGGSSGDPGGGKTPLILTEDGIPAEGLAAHYSGWRGVLKEGGEEAKSGDTVWGWQDQAALFGDNTLRVPDGATGPTLKKLEKAQIKLLKGPTPVLQFAAGDALAIPLSETLGDSDEWKAGISFSIVLKSSEGNSPRPLHFLSGKKAGASAAELVFKGNNYEGGIRLSSGESGFSSVKVNKNSIAIITAVWDRQGEHQRLFSWVPGSHRNSGPKIRMAGGPKAFYRWVLGEAKKDGTSAYAGSIFELAIYNRALSDREVDALEDAMAKRYFEKP